MNREELIERVVKKYGHPKWKVEFAADHLWGRRDQAHPERLPHLQPKKYRAVSYRVD